MYLNPEQGTNRNCGADARRSRGGAMRNKNIFLGVAMLGIVAVIFAVGSALREPKVEATPTPTPIAEVDAPSRFILINTEEGKTALEALKNQLTVETKSFSFGEMITSINGLAATDTEGWFFYVNGVESSVGAGDYTPVATDKLEFRYEAF